MNKEEIRKMAREYMDRLYTTSMLKQHPEVKVIADMTQSILDKYLEDMANDYAEFLTWLLDRYCIVPKERVQEYYRSFKIPLNANLGFKYIMDYHKGVVGAMEHIFGQQLFEENEKVES